MTTKISSTLPGGDTNGLHVISKALTERPSETHVVICVIDTKTLTVDVATGNTVPTAQVLSIEVINPDPRADDLDVAQRLMRRASERRHGGEMLPIKVEDQFTALFERVDRDHIAERVEAEEAAIAAAEAALAEVEGGEPPDPEGDVTEDADAAALAEHEDEFDAAAPDGDDPPEPKGDPIEDDPGHGPKFSG